MKNFPVILAVLTALLFTSASAGEIILKDIQGKNVEPLSSKDGKPVVLIFIATDCPVANGYVPEINRIFTAFSGRGVHLTLVHPEPSTSTEEALTHAGEYGIKPTIVIDKQHLLVKATGATTTPEAAVFDKAGKLAYLGRINNQYSDYGDRRATVSEHNLRDALDALLAGNPIKIRKAPALGCLIEPLSPPQKQ